MNHRVLLARVLFVAMGCVMLYWGWWLWSFVLGGSPPDVSPTVMVMAGLGAYVSAAVVVSDSAAWNTVRMPLCKRDDDPKSF